MLPASDVAKSMLLKVAQALGPDMLSEVAFVGGCTTSLLITDAYSLEVTRYTDDVDLIVDIVGRRGWYELQDILIKEKGFTFSHEDKVLCRLRLGSLKVDFMPHDGSILGFTNRWYKAALETAEPYILNDEITIRVLTPPMFIATKLEAYNGRGNDNPIDSKDIEDIIALFDGRAELVAEIHAADPGVREYVSSQLCNLMKNGDFEYAVQGSTRSDKAREELIFQRIEAVL